MSIMTPSDQGKNRTLARFAGLPVGHLRLSLRSRHATACFKNIGELVNSWTQGYQSGWTPSVRRELDFVIDRLVKALKASGVNGWDKFRRSRSLPQDPEGPLSIYFMSPSLQSMDVAAGEEHLSKLHLKVRTINVLESSGIFSINDLIQSALVGLKHLRGAGALCAEDIQASLESLTLSITATGDIDWTRYAKTRGFVILPQSNKVPWSGRQFVHSLHGVLKEVMSLQFGHRNAQILAQRFLKHRDGRPAFDTLSKGFDRTRQRLRMVEEDFVKLLRRVIWLGDYRACLFHLRPEYIRPLKDLAARLDSEGIRGFSSTEWHRMFIRQGCMFSLQPVITKRFRPPFKAKRKYLLAQRWPTLLRELWHVEESELGDINRLLLEVLGFRIDSRVKHHPVALLGDEKSISLRLSPGEIKRLLTFVYPDGLTLDRLVAELEKKFPRHAPTARECLQLLKTIPAVELAQTGLYRVKLRQLRSSVDKCERVLRDEGRVLHHLEFFPKAGLTGKIKGRHSLTCMLGADTRFAAVGRSGYWGLSEWKASTVFRRSPK